MLRHNLFRDKIIENYPWYDNDFFWDKKQKLLYVLEADISSLKKEKSMILRLYLKVWIFYLMCS